MSVLGAVLAGGQSSRFGSDKAVATLHGERLIDRACNALAQHCDAVAVIGREGGVADWPAPGMGPLGGIAGALRHARETGHALVLSCGVDSVGLPDDLIARLSPAPACVEEQPVIGLWPVTALAALEHLLRSARRHSMRAFAETIGARPITLSQSLANVNTREDLARLEQHHGL